MVTFLDLSITAVTPPAPQDSQTLRFFVRSDGTLCYVNFAGTVTPVNANEQDYKTGMATTDPSPTQVQAQGLAGNRQLVTTTKNVIQDFIAWCLGAKPVPGVTITVPPGSILYSLPNGDQIIITPGGVVYEVSG